MSSDFIIRCSGVGKAFQLYRHQNDQLKQIVLGLWKKFYTEKWVLTDVNFDIAKGERVGIVGHNGAARRRCCKCCAASRSRPGLLRRARTHSADPRVGIGF